MTPSALHLTAEPGTPLVTFEREVAAPRALVYRAYAEPELLAQWLGPRRLAMRVDQYDFRHGGRWRYVQTDTDGTEYGFHGVFHGDLTPDSMVQTFEFEGAPGYVSLDSLTLVDHGDRTLIRVRSVHQSVEARDAMIAHGMEGGVAQGFERLDELLARLAGWDGGAR